MLKIYNSKNISSILDIWNIAFAIEIKENLCLNNYKDLVYNKTALSIARIITILTLKSRFKNCIINQIDTIFLVCTNKSVDIYLSLSKRKFNAKEVAQVSKRRIY